MRRAHHVARPRPQAPEATPAIGNVLYTSSPKFIMHSRVPDGQSSLRVSDGIYFEDLLWKHGPYLKGI